MRDAPKVVWSISYISVDFFTSLKQNFIAYRSSKVSSRPDSIFEIHHLWQSGFSRVYSNSFSSCSFELEIIKLLSHLISYIAMTYWILKILRQFWMLVQKKSGNLLKAPRTWVFVDWFRSGLYFSPENL